MSNFMKIILVGACGQKDRQADVTKLVVVFRNSEKAPKNKLPITQSEAKMIPTSENIMAPIDFRVV